MANGIRVSTNAAAVIVLAAALGGCANTPNQIRTNSPHVSVVAKPVDRVAACFLELYDGMGWSKVVQHAPRSDGGQTIKRVARQVPAGEAFAFVIDIIPVASGSEVR